MAKDTTNITLRLDVETAEKLTEIMNTFDGTQTEKIECIMELIELGKNFQEATLGLDYDVEFEMFKTMMGNKNKLIEESEIKIGNLKKQIERYQMFKTLAQDICTSLVEQ